MLSTLALGWMLASAAADPNAIALRVPQPRVMSMRESERACPTQLWLQRTAPPDALAMSIRGFLARAGGITLMARLRARIGFARITLFGRF